jgi:hypothetical protein
MLRHRLHTVDTGAEIDAIQIELEDLRLRELRLDQQSDARFPQLAAVALDVGQEERPRQLLRQRAGPFGAAPLLDIADDGARQADRVDAGMAVKPAVFHRDDGVLQVRGNLAKRDVVALLVEPEPGLAVRAVEDGVADPPRQPVHDDGIT